MQPQLFVGTSEPRPRLFVPARNPDRQGLVHKPLGGLWTSTYEPRTGGSDWLRWCIEQTFGSPTAKELWLLFPDPAARIYTINTLSDLTELLRVYSRADIAGGFFAPINFAALALDYDGLHLTEHGQYATRLSRPCLNGWDCESTVWLNWAFAGAPLRLRGVTGAIAEGGNADG